MHEKFNKVALDFLKKLKELFPSDNKLFVYSYKFKAAAIMDPTKPVEIFMETIKPYGEQILSRDEHFFKHDDYVNAAENFSDSIGLVDYWDSLSIEIKNYIWEQIQSLYILGMGTYGLQDELQQIMTKTNYLQNLNEIYKSA
jgi:hypothetical protein